MTERPLRESWGVGRVVAGRYRLRSVVGAGAMGVVWRADDLRLDREVALKQLRLPPSLAPDETARARQRVFREGRVAARLQHPHAVAVHDVAADDSGQPMLVLEYLPSKSLAAAITEHGTLPPARVALIGASVASALAAAHAAGIVHRDVKPGNVLLAGDGSAKITDFGLSHVVGDAPGDGLVAGTPVFLSPEAALGGGPDPASDVFSLGATLYTAVEGWPPFGTADNPVAQLERVAAGQAPPPRRAGPLTHLLTSMLRDDPATRPTMSWVADAMADIAATHGDGAMSWVDTDPVPPTPRTTGRRRTRPTENDETQLVPTVEDEVAWVDADPVPPATWRPTNEDATQSFRVTNGDVESTWVDLDPVPPTRRPTPEDDPRFAPGTGDETGSSWVEVGSGGAAARGGWPGGRSADEAAGDEVGSSWVEVGSAEPESPGGWRRDRSADGPDEDQSRYAPLTDDRSSWGDGGAASPSRGGWPGGGAADDADEAGEDDTRLVPSTDDEVGGSVPPWRRGRSADEAGEEEAGPSWVDVEPVERRRDDGADDDDTQLVPVIDDGVVSSWDVDASAERAGDGETQLVPVADDAAGSDDDTRPFPLPDAATASTPDEPPGTPRAVRRRLVYVALGVLAVALLILLATYLLTGRDDATPSIQDERSVASDTWVVTPVSTVDGD